jgi:hypothetical protein
MLRFQLGDHRRQLTGGSPASLKNECWGRRFDLVLLQSSLLRRNLLGITECEGGWGHRLSKFELVRRRELGGRTAVIVYDLDDAKRGELTVLPGIDEAARLAEDLIEAGVEIERIRVLEGTELSVSVAHKVIVRLGGEEA